MSQTTKRALEASLKKLLLQKPLNKITINDITEDCGVNRMTFYYHFKDIYDLVDWIMVEDAAKALEEKPTFDTWSEAYLDLLRQVQENKVLVMNVYRSMSREQVEQYLYRILDPMLREFLDRGMQGITVQDADKQFIVDFYKYALVGMTLEWIRRDMKEDPVRMTERLNILPTANSSGRCAGSARTAVRRIWTIDENLSRRSIVMGFPSRCFFCLWNLF